MDMNTLALVQEELSRRKELNKLETDREWQLARSELLFSLSLWVQERMDEYDLALSAWLDSETLQWKQEQEGEDHDSK